MLNYLHTEERLIHYPYTHKDLHWTQMSGWSVTVVSDVLAGIFPPWGCTQKTNNAWAFFTRILSHQITKTLQYLLGEEHVKAEMSDLILYLLILSLSSFTSFLLLTLAYTHSDRLLEKTTVPEYKHVLENTWLTTCVASMMERQVPLSGR